MKVDDALLHKTRRVYRFATSTLTPMYTDRRFRSAVKITNKQWARYLQTGRLKVSPRSVEIMEALSALPINSPHFQTMVRVLEARYNTKLP